jgi:hypothetical protein
MADADDDRRHVFLDPDGTGSDQGWVYVIVAAPTGVVYQVQGGGVGCVAYAQEGYLITVFGQHLDEELREIFIGELNGQGAPTTAMTCSPPDWSSAKRGRPRSTRHGSLW